MRSALRAFLRSPTFSFFQSDDIPRETEKAREKLPAGRGPDLTGKLRGGLTSRKTSVCPQNPFPSPKRLSLAESVYTIRNESYLLGGIVRA